MHIIRASTYNEYFDVSQIFEINAKRNTNTEDQTYESSSLPHATTQGGFFNDINGIKTFFASVENCLDKPTSKDLPHYVIPYCAAQWKILGDLLGIPSHKIQLIEKNFHHIVEDCCRELLQTWLQSNTEASWKILLSALNSPAIHLNFTWERSSSLSKYRSHLISVYTKRKTL